MSAVAEGAVRFVVAQEALNHLQQNLAAFEKIFTDFHIPKTDYQLLAGFDEDLIRGRLGFLNQIHILIRSEPSDISSFLSHLSSVLDGFSAFVFTDKSIYRIPLSDSEFLNIVRQATLKTARELPGCPLILSQDTANATLTIGNPGGQSSNGTGAQDDSGRKGKEREAPERPDSGRTGESNTDAGSPGPGNDHTQSAEISFRVITHLHRYSQAHMQGAPRSEPFQELQIQGTVKVKV